MSRAYGSAFHEMCKVENQRKAWGLEPYNWFEEIAREELERKSKPKDWSPMLCDNRFKMHSNACKLKTRLHLLMFYDLFFSDWKEEYEGKGDIEDIFYSPGGWSSLEHGIYGCGEKGLHAIVKCQTTGNRIRYLVKESQWENLNLDFIKIGLVYFIIFLTFIICYCLLRDSMHDHKLRRMAGR